MDEYTTQNSTVKIASRVSSSDDRLGIVRAPSDANRCTAISKRSGKRCKRYRQAGSNVCAKHASSVRQSKPGAPNPRDSGLDTQAAERAADIDALQRLIDSPNTLGSDRIRAIEAKQRILQRVDEDAREEKYGPLVALKHALDSLPEGERVEALGRLLMVAD